ncbi:trehalose-phosphatase [Skermanella mucosa]|uniref:trehalose-phosphatase n=1 Tax=Skermanella mucosa TaxID=1789672 RepID=UPI00192C455E|nr:trehalose-phosphatase [Skermanella mucosa]UEM19860.1 trehalose-phosphatase [Skermanella mucosa]
MDDQTTPPMTELPAPSPDWALFLDFDGTLVDIAAQPDGVQVAPGLPELLTRLHGALGGAVALVSGRGLDDIDRLLGRLPLAAAGQHGLERRDAEGRRVTASIDRTALAEITKGLEEFVAAHPGTRLEPKGMTVALHFRNAPEAEADARAATVALMERFGDGFHVQEGKMVLEVKPKGSTKGTVVEQLLAEPPFAGRTPVFVGDDVTDEDGFRVANAHGGLSIQIGTRLPTEARTRIPSVPDLHRWLADMADRLR